MVESTATALPLDRAVVVIGAGTMGAGIAEVAASAGHVVYLCDTSEAALDRGRAQIRASLDKRVAKAKIAQHDAEAVYARVHAAGPGAPLERVGLVIEAIVENLEIKVAALRDMAARVDEDAILSTNTSSLSVTALASRLPQPGRVVGMHFFNPATILPLVEVVRGQASDPDVVDTIVATARAWKKVPVVCQSTPGFIVNRVARPFYGEALRLLLEQHTTPETLDAVMRECGGFRMGPCELMDLIGHDVNFAVTRSVWEGFFHDPRYQPSLVQKQLVDAGWLGRKSGRGFFAYGEGQERTPIQDLHGSITTQVVIEGDLGPAAALGTLIEEANIPVHYAPGRGLIRVDGVALALTDGRSAAARSVELGEPVVLFDLALDYRTSTRIALAGAVDVSPAQLDSAAGLFTALGKKVSVLGDAAGMAVSRTVAMLVNEAADAVQQGIASEHDVDAAMTGGVNYPLGPLAWGRKVELPYVAGVIRHLSSAYGEDRYRVSPWLQARTQAEARAHG
ncbi:3-hydroxyacyl-CoA dehydrogenase [Pseudoxanthomonas sp. GM95]|uniref:3-hydroxyacyl-CoA dehydrogenase n=1 Tax=Pseudoxanthomonas sp. GM95 TaxID=1881043 RepID=UPI0008AE0D8F|nr:3-hydroxyacyl-CoA dehydrogenase [Pseudoxanthomonas sp. GM95]SEL58383.1 3-hydroxyacyl-CoA dehydrogenase [Pseudoxanthomonas sp. GM95]